MFQTLYKCPFTINYKCTGEGYKYFPKNDSQGTIQTEIVLSPDGRKIISFGWPWTYYIDIIEKLRIDCQDDNKIGLLIDGGAGFIIENSELLKVIKWYDSIISSDYYG